MEVRRILGIDPGTQITGYGIITCSGNKMELITHGIIRLGTQQISHAEKLKKIHDRVSSLVMGFKPGEFAIESPFHGKNVQAMLKLGRAQGVAMAAAMAYDIPVYEYAPRKIKMAVTGRGTASKEQVAGMLEKLLHFKVGNTPLDATDGLAVAVCHFFQNKALNGGQSYSDWKSFVKKNPNRVK